VTVTHDSELTVLCNLCFVRAASVHSVLHSYPALSRSLTPSCMRHDRDFACGREIPAEMSRQL